MKLLPLLLLCFLLSGCFFKTAEEIRREKLLDSLALQMTEIQKKSIGMDMKIGDLQKEVSLFNGLIEETGHEKEQSFIRGFKELRSDIALIQADNKKQQDMIDKNKKNLKDQKNYLDRLLATLDKITTVPKSKKKRGKKLSAYNQAMADYKAKRYKTAQKALLKLEKSKKIRGKRKARILHNLGMIEYMQKDYNEALIYLSRLFTEYTKSGYNKNGLYHLGLSFQKLKKKAEAKQAFQQLISSHPKCWQAGKARKRLKALK